MTRFRWSLAGVVAAAAGLLLLQSCPRPASGPTTFGVGSEVTVDALSNWSQIPWPGSTSTELIRAEDTPDGVINDARMMVTIEKRLGHAEGLDRLGQIAAEAPGATFLLIDGWPAVERRETVLVPQPEIAEDSPRERAVLVTTAIAAGDIVVRSEASIREGSTAAEADVVAIGRSMRFVARPDAAASQADLDKVRAFASRALRAPARGSRVTPRRTGPTPAGPTPPPPIASLPGTPSAVTNRVGELEVAASNDGREVVVASQSLSTFFSSDAGRTFKSSAVMLPPLFGNNGDPSVALGASGRFYLAFLGLPSAGGCTASVAVSPPSSGASFSFVGNAASCPGSGNPQCFPDQEHIAADPNPSGKGTDQLYVVWRHFTSWAGGNCPSTKLNYPSPAISCSQDGGASWIPPVPLAGGDDARVTVGGDGSVWVVQRNRNAIAVTKFSSCESGLVLQAGFPKDLVYVSDPACPVAGLDRCTGDGLSSATIAVDRTDPNHVYIAYANSTSSANDDIDVVDTSDGFATWPTPLRSVTVSGPAIGRRFMPWACTLGSSVQVGWYDRRAATSTTNDLTGYFRNSALVDSSGMLVSGTEVDVSVSSDPQCATGFPCGERNLADADTCPSPQLDGFCDNALSLGSKTPCDQDKPSCPTGEVCVPNGGNFGCPKYGDYNGIACAAGHVYAAWASATPPPGLRAPMGIGVFVDALSCGGPDQPCCLSGEACGSELSCSEGTCRSSKCGAPDQPCCGTSCKPGSGCGDGTCVECPPPPRTLLDTTESDGSDCGGTSRSFDFNPSCDAGFDLQACTATLVTEANGASCTATPLGGCGCRLTVTTPRDCGKHATCRLTITEKSTTPPPLGCPGGPKCGDSGQACCDGGMCNSGFLCSAGVCTEAMCGADGEVCCANGPACNAGLECSGGKCALVHCGGAGELCCPGGSCAKGTTCSAGTCLNCPTTTNPLIDATAHNGSDCGGTNHDYFYGPVTCDPGFEIGTCSATLSSQPNGSTCSATPVPNSCQCKVTVTTPKDCTKWADCHVVVDEVPAKGCP